MTATCSLYLIFGLGQARAQLLDRYFPANVPAYQDWFANLATPQGGDEYTPLGVRVGDFVIRPDASETAGYDSNVTGIATGRGSAVLQTDAAVSVDSDWVRNGVNAALSVDNTRYTDIPEQSFTTWTASAGGVVNYANNEIRLGYAHLNTVTLPTDVGTFGLASPITNQVDDVRVSDTIGPGPLTVVPALIGQLYRFNQASNGPGTSLGPLYNRDALTGSVTAGYEFAGGHNLLVIASDTHVAYQHAGQALFPADYDDASIVAGIEYRQSALISYRATVGWERRVLEGAGQRGPTLSAPSAELDVLWTPDLRTSITGRITQSLQDEPAGITQGLTVTTEELDLKRWLRENIALAAAVRYDTAQFPGGNATETAVSASASVEWRLNRNLDLTLRYDYIKSDDSAAPELRFSRNQVLLQVGLQL